MESFQNDIALNGLSNPPESGYPRERSASNVELEHHVLQEGSLPRADGGKDAWLFLAAGFIVEAMVWGLPFSFGIFQEYYSIHQPFPSSTSGVAVIGTTATGIMYLAGLLHFPAYKAYPNLANTSKWLGIPMMAGGLIAGSFSNSVNQLIITQGAVYAFGGCLVYYPTLLYIDEWFLRRKGFAFGVMWAGSGTAGLIFPFVLNSLLSNYGFRTTLRIWAIALMILSTPLIYFIRPRLPIRTASSISASTNVPPHRNHNFFHLPDSLAFLRTSAFWVLELGLVVESLGYFLPTIYLPTYSTSISSRLSLSSSTAATTTSTQPLLISLLNLATVFSTILFGFLIDRYHVTTVILISTIGSTISVFVFWGLSSLSIAGTEKISIALIYVFSIFYGFFAGGFVATNAGMIKLVKSKSEMSSTSISTSASIDHPTRDIVAEDTENIEAITTTGIGEGEAERLPTQIDVGLLIAFISAGRGIGAIVSGPLSDVLLNLKGSSYGGGYENLIIFTGVTAAVGGGSFAGRWMGWL